jgi:hypothetical protein
MAGTAMNESGGGMANRDSIKTTEAIELSLLVGGREGRRRLQEKRMGREKRRWWKQCRLF